MAKITGGLLFCHDGNRVSGFMRVEVKGAETQVTVRGSWDTTGIEVATESGTALKLAPTGWAAGPKLKGAATPKRGKAIPMVAFAGKCKTGVQYQLSVDRMPGGKAEKTVAPF